MYSHNDAISNLRINYANVQTWTEIKNSTLAPHVTKNDPDVILIADIGKIDRQKPIKLHPYLVFVTNKNNEHCAGAAIAVRKGLNFKVLNNFDYDTIGVQIQTHTGPLIIMTNYSPPRHYNIPNSDLEYAIRNNWPVIIVADLNARHSMFGYTGRSNPKGRQLNKLVFNNKLNYVGPGFPTFFSHNNIHGTKPDSVLTNNKFYFNYHVSPGGMGPSDHMAIHLKISCNPILLECPAYENYTNTNWGTYKDNFKFIPQINLESKFLSDLHQEINSMFSNIKYAKEKATPIVKFKRIRTSKCTVKFKRLTKILDYYSTKLLTTGRTPYIDRKLNETRNALVDEGNTMKYLWWEEQLCKVEAAANDNCKFWRQVNKIQGKPTNQIPILKSIINGNEIEAETQEEKIKMLTNIWSNIYQISPQENMQFCSRNEAKVKMHLNKIYDKITPKWQINLNELENHDMNLKLDVDDIKLAIKNIRDKCPGPSKLRKKHFEELPDNILHNLTHIFNCCLSVGYYPKQFKHAHLIFIHKNGTDKHNPLNYRPISLLNTMGKIFGKILNNKLNNFLQSHNIIKDTQHGFRPKRGTSSLIANTYERISREKDDKKTLITVVLRDISKAFDKVHKDSLIYKLSKLNMPVPLLRILSNFLQDRTAQVKLHSKLGEAFELMSGVPQGDILSPTLFLIMINDFPQPDWGGNKRNFVMQYADDFTQVIITKCNKVNDHSRTLHRENVKHEILKQNIFERKWKIKTNVDKFQMIMIANVPKQNINVDNITIEYTNKANLLGLHFKSNNFFKQQIDNNIKKAKYELSRLYRLRYLKKKIKVRLYKSKVLPHLTNSSVPLNICSHSQIKRLQIVQNKAIRWITNTYYPNICNVDEQQNILKIEPVSDRISRLAHNIWYKIESENSPFFEITKNIPIEFGHAWFKSSYAATFE